MPMAMGVASSRLRSGARGPSLQLASAFAEQSALGIVQLRCVECEPSSLQPIEEQAGQQEQDTASVDQQSEQLPRKR